MQFFKGTAVLLSILLVHGKRLASNLLLPTVTLWPLFTTLPSVLLPYWHFFYASFLKHHSAVLSNGQRDALEGFYSGQAESYDVTRARLLKGREDMLALAAAQLKCREKRANASKSRVWIDIGGGTGFNIEAMRQFLDVPNYFSSIYLVDFSPSLCNVARKRFQGLGWTNVHVVCQDARYFQLHEQEDRLASKLDGRKRLGFYDDGEEKPKASLVTFSYSLSMIPDFHSVIDSIPAFLAPSGILSVVDFYVQSGVEIGHRNYGGGSFDRHVNWLGRAFWRSWFELDRVALEPARRDYLEYRFGTILSFNKRHYYLGAIPYYTWIGCQRRLPVEGDGQSTEVRVLEWLDRTTDRSTVAAAGLLNPSRSLPLPSAFYQNHPIRLHYNEYDDQHTQFQNEYIYAFTWEDPVVDKEILQISSADTILAITSAGDNILSYALCNPKMLHAVDLNPAQNHLLELKLAAFASLSYQDTWKLFGLGKHADFSMLLLEKLSPHLSSQALQFWISNARPFTSRFSCGLYETGGSRHAVRLAKYLFTLAGLRKEVHRLCNSETVEEQRVLWRNRLRGILLNRALHWAVISHPRFLWKALGVPHAQKNMIVQDHKPEGVGLKGDAEATSCGEAIWKYMVDTLDPVIEHSLLKKENYFYSLCLRGRYTERCHPEYLSRSSHSFLRDKPIYPSLRIHTSPLATVLCSMLPSSLTIAVIMDSMDWFPPSSPSEASSQIRALNRALVPGGRVLLRSAASKPWYLDLFEDLGFRAERKTHRCEESPFTDRVNMYKSCWLCIKVAGLPPSTPESLPEGDEGAWGSGELP